MGNKVSNILLQWFLHMLQAPKEVGNLIPRGDRQSSPKQPFDPQARQA